MRYCIYSMVDRRNAQSYTKGMTICFRSVDIEPSKIHPFPSFQRQVPESWDVVTLGYFAYEMIYGYMDYPQIRNHFLDGIVTTALRPRVSSPARGVWKLRLAPPKTQKSGLFAMIEPWKMMANHKPRAIHFESRSMTDVNPRKLVPRKFVLSIFFPIGCTPFVSGLRTTTLLQKGAEHGLSLHQIGLIMYREDRSSEDEAPIQPSILACDGSELQGKKPMALRATATFYKF